MSDLIKNSADFCQYHGIKDCNKHHEICVLNPNKTQCWAKNKKPVDINNIACNICIIYIMYNKIYNIIYNKLDRKIFYYFESRFDENCKIISSLSNKQKKILFIFLGRFIWPPIKTTSDINCQEKYIDDFMKCSLYFIKNYLNVIIFTSIPQVLHSQCCPDLRHK